MANTLHNAHGAVLHTSVSPAAGTVSTAPTSIDAGSTNWLHDGPNLNLVRGTEVLHSLAVDEVYPIGPETVEVLEMMRSTPFYTADVIVHLLAFVVENDMQLQESLDEMYFAEASASSTNQDAAI